MTALIISLIIVGIFLILAEFLVIPGFGIAGVLGLASMVGSCWITYTEFGHFWGSVVVATNILIFIVVLILSLRSNTWKKLSLKTNIKAKVDNTPMDKGISIGTKGISTTRLAPSGLAKFNNTTTEVFSMGALVEPNTPIIVEEIEGNKIVVTIEK